MAHRDRWASRQAFIMAAVGSAIGLGNLWRFPMVAYSNGGGAFLIPYIVALMTAGVPLMILEYSLGSLFQKSSPGSLHAANPKFEFIGWWALGIGSTISFYYAVVMGWSWDYLACSFGELPWCVNAQAFFDNLLGLTSGPGEIGAISWPALVGLAATWVLIYWIIKAGVLRVGKVVMLTVPLPVILLVLILIRGLTLPGAAEGLAYYLTPDFSALTNARTWLQAYAQVFFSLSLGFGILTAYASYLPKRSDIANNAFITSFADAGFAFFAGFSVFSVLGYLAQTQGVPIDEVVRGGPGLAFVIYPTAMGLMPLAPLVSVMFFVTLLTLGIDSAFSIVEGAVAGLRDKWHISQQRAALYFSIFGFLVGIIFTTGAGLYWLDIVDRWMNDYGLVVIGLLECIAIGWFYGTGKLKAYINEVSDFKIGIWWDIFIKWVTPLALGWAIVMSIVQDFTRPYGDYPAWALIVGGWGVVAAIVVTASLITKLRPFKDNEEE
ncbi:MAG: sodium-dependent transporter [Candidatus Eisenbacteria bacterium]|nr:sodium-dependent transporter [Candidatus Eisenbacteria bacterium]